MARGTTLGELVDKLRTSARYDPNPALSKNMLPLMQQTLRDVQERLYDDFDWPFLKVRRDKTLSAGQRYYDLPDDMNLERVDSVDTLFGGHWLAVDRGISLENFNEIDSESGIRQDPALRWDIIDAGDGEQVEVWPIPVSNGGTLRFSGYRNLKPLVKTADEADLDDQLIVLFSAAELLAGAKNPLAQARLQQANERYHLLRGRSTKTRTKMFVLGGAGPADCDKGRPPPLVAYVRNP